MEIYTYIQYARYKQYRKSLQGIAKDCTVYMARKVKHRQSRVELAGIDLNRLGLGYINLDRLGLA